MLPGTKEYDIKNSYHCYFYSPIIPQEITAKNQFYLSSFGLSKKIVSVICIVWNKYYTKQRSHYSVLQIAF